MPKRGLFIVLEGGDGAGKSTQARLLADRMGALLTRQPGGTSLGTSLRGILLDTGSTSLVDRAEALMIAADKAQHVVEVVQPALIQGQHVVSDRYIWSSVAYQGGGRGMNKSEILRLCTWATEGLIPDLTLMLEVDADNLRRRLGSTLDRFELAGNEFHDRVRNTYHDLAIENGAPIINGEGSIEEVHNQIWAYVAPLLERYQS
jgi:dTMP kinase